MTEEGLLVAEIENDDLTLQEVPGATNVEDHGLWKGEDGVLSTIVSDDEGDRRLVRNVDGSWSEEALAGPWSGEFFDYTSTVDGDATLWSERMGKLVAWQEQTQEITELGPLAQAPFRRGEYAVLTPARPVGEASKEGLLALRAGADMLAIASLDGGEPVEFEIPSAPVIDFACKLSEAPLECVGGCEDTAEGVEANLMGLAQTQDDRIWAVWLHSHMDQSYCWVWQDEIEPDGGGACLGRLTSDDSWAELVIAEVDLAGRTVHERMRTPVARPRTESTSSDYKTVPSLAIASYGNRLALSFGEQGSWPALRVMVLDTSEL